MPKYQTIKTYESGFYNNIVVNGINTRVYSAEDMTEPYSSIFSDGVKPNANGVLGDDLAVRFVDGIKVQVMPGYGLFGGKYFKNNAPYEITLDNPTTTARYDCIIVASDKRSTVNETTIYVKSLDHLPTISDLTRNDEVKEFLLAYAVVQGETAEISQGVIFDTRLDQTVCGVITGVYNQLDGKEIYTQWQAIFDTWLAAAKDAYRGSTTLIRYYASQYVTTAENEKVIPINISQYNMETDSILVYVNGLVLSPQTGYTVKSNTEVELALALPVIGTKVMIEVFKSVDGAQANTVVNEVRTLQEQVARLESFATMDYYCNGINDNVKLSELALAFLQKGSDYQKATIRVFGNVGAVHPSDGVWFKLGTDSVFNRRLAIDFGNAGAITLQCQNGQNYTVFEGEQVHIKNCNLIANCNYSDSSVKLFDPASGAVRMEDSRVWINAKNNSFASANGTFENCRISVTNGAGNSYCFKATGLLRLIGGEYYSYTGLTSGASSVVYVESSATSAVVIAYGISCPTAAISGHYQKNAIITETSNAKCSFTDTVTNLTISATGQNIRGTIVDSKPGIV